MSFAGTITLPTQPPMLYDRESSDRLRTRLVYRIFVLHIHTPQGFRYQGRCQCQCQCQCQILTPNANLNALPTHSSPLIFTSHHLSYVVCLCFSSRTRQNNPTRALSVASILPAYNFHESIFSKPPRSSRPSISTLDRYLLTSGGVCQTYNSPSPRDLRLSAVTEIL